MDKRKTYYLLHSGKNSNLKYYVKCYLRELTPRWLSGLRLEGMRAKFQNKFENFRDYSYLCTR